MNPPIPQNIFYSRLLAAPDLPDQIKTILGISPEQAAKTGIYEICHAIVMLMVNTPRLYVKMTDSYHPFYLPQDLLPLKNLTQTFVHRYAITTADPYLDFFKRWHTTLVTAELCFPKAQETTFAPNANSHRIFHFFTDVPDHIWAILSGFLSPLPPAATETIVDPFLTVCECTLESPPSIHPLPEDCQVPDPDDDIPYTAI